MEVEGEGEDEGEEEKEKEEGDDDDESEEGVYNGKSTIPVPNARPKLRITKKKVRTD